MKVIILLSIITTIAAGGGDSYSSHGGGGHSSSAPLAWWDLDAPESQSNGPSKKIPFPKCLESYSKHNYFEESSLNALFDRSYKDEDHKYKREGFENHQKHYNDIVEYDADEYRKDFSSGRSRLSPAAAVGVTDHIMRKSNCDLKGTDSFKLNKVFSKYKVPGSYCSFYDNPNCHKKTTYRTATGVCNNLKYPYTGSSHTAYARYLAADYADYVSKPRQYSVVGGHLPSCRKISLAFGSKPVFDRTHNNFFVIFGQFLSHDITLAPPVTDHYLTPVTTCSCNSKDWNKCTVIDIEPDDPYLSGQKCMAFPATAPAFHDVKCSYGVKEQINANTHYFDLSSLYGSTQQTANGLRTHNGKLKASKIYGFKYEYPPGQVEGKSCIDGTYKRPCFAGGDSRLMENPLFTGIHVLFLRLHNMFAEELYKKNPTASDELLYQSTRRIVTELYEIISLYWVAELLGEDLGTKFKESVINKPYNEEIQAVVVNEVATAALRCHTLVRDLFTRCTPEGNRIDQLWLNDLTHKAKYSYDIKNNGIDSILCGSLYDYGFAHDGNIAHQLHNRLFETTDKKGYFFRNDLFSINICRGREHGVGVYNAYREYCGMKRAYYFEDFGDAINYDGIKLLSETYQHPDDVDFIVGLALEDRKGTAMVGPTTACLLAKQFEDLCVGDRFCVARGKGFTPASLQEVAQVALRFLACTTIDIKHIPNNLFEPPDYKDNILIDCSVFNKPNREFFPTTGVFKNDGSYTDGPSLEDLLVPYGYPAPAP